MSASTEKTAAAEVVDHLGRPARPPGYWARIDRIVDQAPPLTDLQRAKLRAIFHQPGDRKEQAA